MKAKGDIEILLADDERVFRSGMKALLESEGFAVRTARDGEAAVRKFAERVPDVVILDVMMPRMNGFRACEEIRKTDRRVPVVFLTAKDGEVDQVRALGLGADDYVSKSAPEALLVARIRRAVERARELVAGRTADADGCIHLGQTTVDMTSLEVTVGGESAGRLTKTEATSSPIEPEGITGKFSAALSLIFMMEPLPKSFSILSSVDCSALSFSKLAALRSFSSCASFAILIYVGVYV